MHAFIYIRVCDTGDEIRPLDVDRALVMVEVYLCVFVCLCLSVCECVFVFVSACLSQCMCVWGGCRLRVFIESDQNSHYLLQYIYIYIYIYELKNFTSDNK